MTIENESDLKNANYLKNEMKKKTNIGRKILKAIRLICQIRLNTL